MVMFNSYVKLPEGISWFFDGNIMGFNGVHTYIYIYYIYVCVYVMVEGSLEVKLPTIWTVEKQR